MTPRGRRRNGNGRPLDCWRSLSAAEEESWALFFSDVDSMRLDVFTVSPKRQYLGLVLPTTDATTGPLWKPARMLMLQE